MPATEITLSGKYKRLDGTAASGTVSFELSGTLMDQSGDVLYPSLKRVAQLDSDGALSVVLPATKGDVTTSPIGLVYRVRESISPGLTNVYSIELDTANGLTQDLSDIAPATNVTVQTYALVSTLAAHTAATENIHGIPDTAQLATLADLAGKANTTDVTSAQAAAEAFATSAVTTHTADTTAVHGIADTSLLATMKAGSFVDASGTITTANTAQALFAASPSRRYLIIQNQSNGVLWINFGVDATPGQPSIQVLPNGGAYEMSGLVISTETVSIIGSSVGQAFTAKEL